jgi:hypothetical protein
VRTRYVATGEDWLAIDDYVPSFAEGMYNDKTYRTSCP